MRNSLQAESVADRALVGNDQPFVWGDQCRIYGGRSFSDLYASSSGNKTCGFKYTGFGIWI